jgi:hypothetical protein
MTHGNSRRASFHVSLTRLLQSWVNQFIRIGAATWPAMTTTRATSGSIQSSSGQHHTGRESAGIIDSVRIYEANSM